MKALTLGFKTILQYMIPKKTLTKIMGYLAEVKVPWFKNLFIKIFIKYFKVDMTEALEEDPEKYLSFNDFFTRHLKPDARPIANADIISPVDGQISEIGNITQGTLIQAKGKKYTVSQLIGGDETMAGQFANGLFATLYLSPKDYHRVHMPIDAQLTEMNYMPGTLFSVQPATVKTIPNLFTKNERLAVFFDTNIGPMAMVLVGATIVGSIATSWHGNVIRSKKNSTFSYNTSSNPGFILPKSEEMGLFKLGSTVILLFADSNQVELDPKLKAGDTIKLGEKLGSIVHL